MIISITHEHDLDGIGSQAILYRFLTRNKDHGDEDVQLHYAHYSNFPKSIKQFLSDSALPDQLIITDIGFNDEFEELLPYFKKAKQKGCEISWFDHHLVDDSVKEKIKLVVNTYINDPSRCAAEIVKDYFLPDDSIAIEIAQYARDRDFGKYNFQISTDLQSIIEFNRGRDRDKSKRKITKLLASGIFKNDWLDEQLKELADWRNKQEANAINNVKLIKIKDFGEIAISLAEMSGGRIIHVLEENFKNAKGYVGIDSRFNEINLYSDYFNCRQVARHFRGGGHINRSGLRFSGIL
ncbi:MAG: hypothetical protein EU517_01035, partial [Promethearchaeota archaeon]